MNTAAPASVTNPWANFSGLAALIIVAVVMARYDLEPITRALIAMAAVAVPIVCAEQLIFRRRVAPRRPFAPARVAIKLLGLAGTLAVVAAAYSVFPIYNTEYYDPFFVALRLVGPYVAAVTLVYVPYVDRIMDEPEDGYFYAGLVFLGRWTELDQIRLMQFGLGWLVKAFLLPIMFCMLCEELSVVTTALSDPHSLDNKYEVLWRIEWVVDLAFSTVGYALALRILDNEIRSVERTPRLDRVPRLLPAVLGCSLRSLHRLPR